MVVISGNIYWVKNNVPNVYNSGILQLNNTQQEPQQMYSEMVMSTTVNNNNNNNNNSTETTTDNTQSSVTTTTTTTMSCNNNNSNTISNNNSARAVLICRPNSHPFQERNLILDHPVKVGRSVARARAAPTNAIFDCKVLSRHHAVLWYDNGKFFLQDTKSSNGTFVNNNRLAPEIDHHEVSSGDIVQFGVDVIENNRKVTHGCIIATLKLYLPDGKEAKASPTVTEHDELYKLHQIIQEATHREQCLENKLAALQSIVEEARRSADDSWQAYVGEERLLSQIAALETKLQQSGKNWNEDKYREEIQKLQETNSVYQVAAKEALDKLHAERLEALQTAEEQERIRLTSEQEVVLVKEQLAVAQQNLEEVAQKLTKTDKEKTRLEKLQSDLQTRLDLETKKVEKMQLVIMETSALKQHLLCLGGEKLPSDYILSDDARKKAELIAENEDFSDEKNKSNGLEQNHINLTVAPVVGEDLKDEESDKKNEEATDSDGTLDEDKDNSEKKVTFNVSSEGKDDFELDDGDNVDSKTLKYKYQSAQLTNNELKRQNELLEAVLGMNQLRVEELERMLREEKYTNIDKIKENQDLRDEFNQLEEKLKESCNETYQLKERINNLLIEPNNVNDNKDVILINNKDQIIINNKTIISSSSSNNSYEQLVNLEEELVVLKERYVKSNDEKLKLQHDLIELKTKYNRLCNSSYDKMYFYIAPLILMILYLVISAMIS